MQQSVLQRGNPKLRFQKYNGVRYTRIMQLDVKRKKKQHNNKRDAF